MKKLWGFVILVAIIGIGFPIVHQIHRSQEAFTPNNLIRIHVVANSDSAVDQTVKLKVKDRLVNWLSPELAYCKTAAESRRILSRRLDEIEKVASAELKACGKGYPVRVMLGDFDFPTRQYGELVLPAGRYQALRVVLGSGLGKNWWCVLYPPLCVKSTAAEAKKRQAEWYIKKQVSKPKTKAAQAKNVRRKKK